jgi:uncharacterized protein
MVLAIKPVLACDLNCLYCYQAPFHPHLGSKGTQQKREFDLQKIEASLRSAIKVMKHVTLHGGEPTLMGLDAAERLFKIVKEEGGYVSIQTNGYLLDERWFSLFKKYNVGVGVSLDGPGELNAARGFFDATGQRINPASEAYTKKVINNIYRMRELGIAVGIICVLNKFNATADKLPKLKAWILELREHNIRSGRVNHCFINDPRIKPLLELTPEEAKRAWLELCDLVLSYPDLHWQPFREMVDNLLGLGLEACHFAPCNPRQTDGEVAIEPFGEIVNCTRLINEQGSPIKRENGFQPNRDYERAWRLLHTPQEEGGCSGCRYFSCCHGGCPAQGWDFKQNKPDWYKKDRFCEAIKATYALIEKRLKGLMPNIRLVPDIIDPSRMTLEQYSHDLHRRRARNWNWRPFGWMEQEYSYRPSSYGARIKKEPSPLHDEGRMLNAT